MGDGEAQSDFPDRAQRFAFCNSVYTQARSSAVNILVSSALSEARTRVEHFLGRDFLVVPAVLVRSQVLNNNLGATFLPPEEITDDWADLWNGIPVLVGDHPSAVGGERVSARQPELLDTRGVGWIFGARAEDEGPGIRRLVAEVWLDLARATEVDGFQEVLDAVSAGQTVELSTGFATQIETQSGQFQGEAFDRVLHPVGADHLVVAASDFTGACAVRDGCGLGANERMYIMEDKVANTTTTDDVQLDGSGSTVVSVETPPESRLSRLLNRMAELFTAKPVKQSECWWEDNAARHFGREFEAWNLTNPSDQERMQAIRDSLQEKFGGADREVVVTDVYSDTMQVIYWLTTPLGPQPPGGEFFSSSFEEGENGFTFGDPQRVRRMARYEPVGNITGEDPADAGNNATAVEDHMAEKDTKDLNEQLATLTETVGKLVEKVSEMEERAKADPNPSIAGMKQALAEMAGRLDSMEEPTRAAIAERERERQSLVAKLAGNYRVPFTQADLEAKPIEELRKLSEMVGVADNYASRGGPRGATSKEDKAFMEPVPYTTKKGDE